MDITSVELRLAQFARMLRCCHNLYLWEFDSGYRLIRSNCPHEETVNNMFGMLGTDKLSAYFCDGLDTPVLFTNDVGLVWIMQPLIDSGEPVRLYTLGPLFLDNVSPKHLETQLSHLTLSGAMRTTARSFLSELPIIPLSRVFEYAIMTHYCVTENAISVSDLRYEAHSERASSRDDSTATDFHGTYEDEQEMLRMVREGDIENYRAQLDRLSVTGSMGKLANDDSLRQMKNAVITCLVLFSRAAMEGGLDPEVSYALSDTYFQSIESCGSISELVEIALPMQEDYIRRVHSVRTSGLTAPIRSCCDYIGLHLEDKLDLASLARHSGYAEYYLSRKFKKETGLAPSDYIRRRRLERAAHLLRTTQEDAQKIAARLQFSSQSHFSECFRKQYGMTPTAYRAQSR